MGKLLESIVWYVRYVDIYSLNVRHTFTVATAYSGLNNNFWVNCKFDYAHMCHVS
jgi:uncharacterized protein (UPF0303 family)